MSDFFINSEQTEQTDAEDRWRTFLQFITHKPVTHHNADAVVLASTLTPLYHFSYVSSVAFVAGVKSPSLHAQLFECTDGTRHLSVNTLCAFMHSKYFRFFPPMFIINPAAAMEIKCLEQVQACNWGKNAF